MLNRKMEQRGFGAIQGLLVLVVVCVIAGAAWLTYSRYQTAHQANSSASSSTTTYPPKDTKQEQRLTEKSQVDVYANWKTYCDTFYHYCFKYPSDWSLEAGDTPTSYCQTRQVTLLSPSKDTAVYYLNADSHDNGLFTIYPVSITNLSSANQALSIIGSHIAVSGPPNTNGLAGNDVPSYRIYDSSILSQYHLDIGQPVQFPSRGSFIDKGTGASVCSGSFMANPTFTVNSVADAQAWFDSASAKTSLLILKSFYYHS